MFTFSHCYRYIFKAYSYALWYLIQCMHMYTLCIAYTYILGNVCVGMSVHHRRKTRQKLHVMCHLCGACRKLRSKLCFHLSFLDLTCTYVNTTYNIHEDRQIIEIHAHKSIYYILKIILDFWFFNYLTYLFILCFVLFLQNFNPIL